MRVFRSALLEKCSGVIHGFVHDPGGPDILRIASAYGLEDIITVNQVHGSTVFFVDNAAGEISVEADSIVTRQKGAGVGVITADCVPVLVCFPDSGCVCAVHAGWRGTSLRAVRECIGAVCEQYSLKPQDAVAVIGPAIWGCCYEVRDDVASRFVSRFSGEGNWLLEKGDGKFLLDLVEINRIELCDAGVQQVEIMNLCTCCQGLPSYRRDGSGTDKMISFLGISS
ncbi:MAG: peptidoglycan editing factor PgeF [Candidatus Dadabacteria bacterium]|nr:peptidoglycan editing factor PgeF [Candidatus Dadabacteria bacterium]